MAVTMTKEITYLRNRTIYIKSRYGQTVESLSEQYGLSQEYVAEIISHFTRWGEFA